MFRCQLSNEFGLGHLSGEEVPHRAVVITEKQRAFEKILSCAPESRHRPTTPPLRPVYGAVSRAKMPPNLYYKAARRAGPPGAKTAFLAAQERTLY